MLRFTWKIGSVIVRKVPFLFASFWFSLTIAISISISYDTNFQNSMSILFLGLFIVLGILFLIACIEFAESKRTLMSRIKETLMDIDLDYPPIILGISAISISIALLVASYVDAIPLVLSIVIIVMLFFLVFIMHYALKETEKKL